MQSSDIRLVLPLTALFVAFFLAPLAVLILMSLSTDAQMHGLTGAHYIKFFIDPFNYSILWATILLGVKATLLCLLGRQGVLNQMAMGMGLTSEPLRLLFTELGVVMVLAQVQMPLMVLPILTTLSKIDPNLADASRVLGAGEWRTLWKVTLPLSLPGVLAGCILTYAASVTAFVTQTLIGGARLVYMPLHIYQQAIGANNWPFAAAISVIFMFAVLIVVYLLNLLTRLTPSDATR
jgi:putative spermidine/putrescine transport system permease protein